MRVFARVILTVLMVPLFIIASPILWMLTKALDNSNDGLFIVGLDTIKDLWRK